MKKQLTQISIILVTLTLSACFDPPVFSEDPVIKYRSLRYINYPDRAEGVRDSLILRFDFRDGDGNIGLDDRFDFPPYHAYDSVIDAKGSVVTVGDDSLVAPFYLVDPLGNRTVYSETGDKPAYNECDYKIQGKDTFLIVQNKHNRNFYIDFYRKRSGNYQKINFQEVFGSDKCEQLTFDARIPIFNDEGQGKSMSGTINYNLRSSLWELALSTDTFKVQFYIYDRMLRKSNIEESPDLTLLGITTNRN